MFLSNHQPNTIINHFYSHVDTKPGEVASGTHLFVGCEGERHRQEPKLPFTAPDSEP